MTDAPIIPNADPFLAPHLDRLRMICDLRYPLTHRRDEPEIVAAEILHRAIAHELRLLEGV